MSVRCNSCGQEWPRDPALEVECPTCHAEPGRNCRRPSGYSGPFTGLHASRDHAAMTAGVLKKCPGKAPPPPTQLELMGQRELI